MELPSAYRLSELIQKQAWKGDGAVGANATIDTLL